MKTSDIIAAVATVGAVVTLSAIAITHPELLPDVVVCEEPRHTVVVQNPIPVVPAPGVPAYAVPVGQPYVIQTLGEIRLSHCYSTRYKYVVHNGKRCPIVQRNGCWCYKCGNRYYPVYYY